MQEYSKKRGLPSLAMTVALLVALGAGGCASAPRPYRDPALAFAAPSEDEISVFASAQKFIGQPPSAAVSVRGRPFVLDCIGTVCAIYYDSGMDLTKDFASYTGNGVGRLYKSMMARGIVHEDRLPRPGDLIFWDNTWDANGNGDRTDDPLTHAGIVLSVDGDGGIRYVHEHLQKGVIVEAMNLRRPRDRLDESGTLINSALALASAPGETKAERRLAGELWRAFGDALSAKKYYRVRTDDCDADSAGLEHRQ
jgi:hypothetical protein